jgi:hypothetical protein
MPDWRKELTTEQQGKLSAELQLWLDGQEPDTLEINMPRPGHVQVYSCYAAPVFGEAVSHFQGLGLDAEEADEVSAGVLSRRQLLDLAKDPQVIALTPVGRSQTSGYQR